MLARAVDRFRFAAIGIVAQFARSALKALPASVPPIAGGVAQYLRRTSARFAGKIGEIGTDKLAHRRRVQRLAAPLVVKQGVEVRSGCRLGDLTPIDEPGSHLPVKGTPHLAILVSEYYRASEVWPRALPVLIIDAGASSEAAI